MTHRRHPGERIGSLEHRYAFVHITWSVAAILAVSGSATEVLAKGPPPIEPYGTFAEIQRCVANMEAALQGRSILGSRDTAAYIQDRGNLEDMGVTEYDIMVGRCKNMFFRRYNRSYGR